jgi:hypothetical protein
VSENVPLSDESARQFAAAAIREADPVVSPPVATAAVLILDAVSGAVLAAVGVLPPGAAREVLGLLWRQPDGGVTVWD